MASAMNKKRAGWAKIALLAFMKATRLTVRGDGYYTGLKDLLCDLMHFADQRTDVDFEAALDSARRMFRDEKAKE